MIFSGPNRFFLFISDWGIGKAVIAALAISMIANSLSFAPISRAQSQVSDSDIAFINAHWPDTISLQGPAPANYSALEASLAPKDCGACHKTQYDDWKTSIHSQSMGAGVLGQIINFVESNRATARICWSCHTPLAEQQNVLYKNNAWISNTEFDSQLQREGLICAACHVRKHQRFGPAKFDGTMSTIAAQTKLPHNGFVEEAIFSKSIFCRKCHQFDDRGYKLNGKLIENTYNEWRDSKYAKMGIQCQDCHMPNRRHLWRGIHDQDMVNRAVEIAIIPAGNSRQTEEALETLITITNSGAGHFFPTYLTPKVFVRGYLADTAANMIEGTFQQTIIGRDASLDLSTELYDSRIPPGKTLKVTFSHQIPDNAVSLVVSVYVEPDHFYTKFYKRTLEGHGSPMSKSLITQALQQSMQSGFSIFQETIMLKQ